MNTILGLIFSIAGLAVSLYIYRKQRAKKPLMCPRNAPCETVISSSQAKTFGISNTVLGMIYYVVTGLFFLARAMGSDSFLADVLLLILTTGGFLFSLYLAGVQRFVIRQWCLWCLGSAAAATIIFLATLSIFI